MTIPVEAINDHPIYHNKSECEKSFTTNFRQKKIRCFVNKQNIEILRQLSFLFEMGKCGILTFREHASIYGSIAPSSKWEWTINIRS